MNTLKPVSCLAMGMISLAGLARPVDAAIDHLKLYGFGAMNGGTTGGAGGSQVSITSLSDLQTQLTALAKEKTAAKPTIFLIKGKLTQPAGLSKIEVKENQNITFLGDGDFGEIVGIGFKVVRSKNIIFRNLKIHHVEAAKTSGEGDGIAIEETTNAWVDHCEFYAEAPIKTDESTANKLKDIYDGLVDVKKGSDYVTISWNKFHSHWKATLNGFTDTDAGPLRVTYHHNWFENLYSRLPLNRIGNSHVFNNYYNKIWATGINCRQKACVKIEGNYFDLVAQDSAKAILTQDSDLDGYWDVKDNYFNPTAAWAGKETKSTCTSSLPYSDYTAVLQPAAAVKATVMELAGVGNLKKVAGIAGKSMTPGRLGVNSRGEISWAGIGVGAELSVYSTDGRLVGARRLEAASGLVRDLSLVRGYYLAVITQGDREAARSSFVKLEH